MFGFFTAIGYHYGYKQCEDDKIESNPKYCSEKVLELEKTSATCRSENHYLTKVSSDCETKMTECANDYKTLKEEKHSAVVQFTKCDAASKAEKDGISKDMDNQCTKKMLSLEKANISCYSERKNLDEKSTKREKDLIQCESDRDKFRDSFTTLQGEYIECHTSSKLQIAFEDEKNKKEKKYMETISTLEMSINLEKCEKEKKTCNDQLSTCKSDLGKRRKRKHKKGWLF